MVSRSPASFDLDRQAALAGSFDDQIIAPWGGLQDPGCEPSFQSLFVGDLLDRRVTGNLELITVENTRYHNLWIIRVIRVNPRLLLSFATERHEAYGFSPALNSAQGLPFMSCNTGRSHSNWGCSFRNGSARKSSPQGYPARARSVMFCVMVLSAACAVTAPPG